MVTCPNKMCGKVFDKPIITINLQQTSKIPYNACPSCFTEITLAESQNMNYPEESFTEVELEKEKSDEVSENTDTCSHHLGYLKERELKQQIPEECFLCSRVIECMLKESQ